MKPGNYSMQFGVVARDLSYNMAPETRRYCVDFAAEMLKLPHFFMGELEKEDLERCTNLQDELHLKPPYKEMVLEFSIGTSQHIVIVISDDESIQLIPCTRHSSSPLWQFSHSWLLSGELNYGDFTIAVGALMMPPASRVSRPDLEYAKHLAAYLYLCLVLSCSNASTEDVVPDEKLQKRRMKDGKDPFHTYKVLTIKSSSGQVYRLGESTGRTIRSHMRRGHIRRLPQARGTTWVSPCAVQGKKPGYVSKDYQLG